MLTHPIPPLYDEASRILILGSFPSVRSRETQFFYGHPQNRFWKVISAVCGEEIPQTIEEKKRLLLSHHIALWDVIHSCEIEGSADASIREVTVNDLNVILDTAHIEKIFVNGKTAEKMYNKYIEPTLHRSCVALPSTSSANAAWSLERLIEEWSKQMPKDPIMLLSYVNTQLRDNYSSLAEFAASNAISEQEILDKLESVGYTYDTNTNRFIAR